MESLKQLTKKYIQKFPQENSAFEVLDFLKIDGCYMRENLDGHFTASAWVLSPDKNMVLMTHHKKLEMWLQLGEHADGEEDLLKVALCEAIEESGIQKIKILSNEIFDLDIHEIPLYKNQPAHKHYDIRFLLEADPKSKIIISDESYDVAWIPLEKVTKFNSQGSIRRMVKKTLAIKNKIS